MGSWLNRDLIRFSPQRVDYLNGPSEIDRGRIRQGTREKAGELQLSSHCEYMGY